MKMIDFLQKISVHIQFVNVRGQFLHGYRRQLDIRTIRDPVVPVEMTIAFCRAIIRLGTSGDGIKNEQKRCQK